MTATATTPDHLTDCTPGNCSVMFYMEQDGSLEAVRCGRREGREQDARDAARVAAGLVDPADL